MSKSPSFRATAWVALLLAPAMVACTRRATPADDPGELVDTFKALHRALYGVYDLGADRDPLWDLLDGSFSGDALTQQYVEHFVTLTQMAVENTAIEVLRVDYETVEIVEQTPDRVIVEADWSVGGIVTHQRHKHPRVNRYKALYTLRPADSDPPFRIVDTRMQDLERVRSLGSREGFPLDDLPTSARGLLSAEDLLRSGVLDTDEDQEEEP